MASEFIEIISEQTKAQIDAIMPLVNSLANKIKEINSFSPSNTPSGADKTIKGMTDAYKAQGTSLKTLADRINEVAINQNKLTSRKKEAVTTEEALKKAVNNAWNAQDKKAKQLTEEERAYNKVLAKQREVTKNIRDLVVETGKETEAVKKLQTQLDALNTELLQAEQASKKYAMGASSLATPVLLYAEAQKKATQATKEANAEKAKSNAMISKQMTGSMVESVNAIGKPTESLKRMNDYYRELEKTSAAEAKSALANNKLNDAYGKLTRQREVTSRALRNSIIETGKYSEATRRLQKEFDVLNKKVAAADKAVGRFSEANRKINGLSQSVGNLMTAFGVGTGLYLAVDIAKNIFETTKALQSMDLALKMVSGSQQEFIKNQGFLRSLAEQYGIEIKGLTKNFTEFWVASKGKLEAEQIKAIFTSISKSVAVMGLSVEQQDSAFLALQQMMSKGTVQAEELKKQLGNALPGAVKAATMAYQALHPELKVTEKLFMEQMKAGKVISSELLPELAKAYEKLYGIENVKRAETLQAAQERLKNSWTDLVRSMNESKTGGLSLFFSFIFDGLTNGIKLLARFNSDWDSLYAKATSKGKSLGASAFTERVAGAGFATSTREEKLNMVLNKARKELIVLRKQESEINKEISKFNPYAINLGKSGKDMKKEKEQILLDIAARAEIIRLAKIELQPKETVKNKENATETETARKKREATALKAERNANKERERKKIDFSESVSGVELLKAELEREKSVLEDRMNNEENSFEDRLKLRSKFSLKSLEILETEFQKEQAVINRKGLDDLREVERGFKNGDIKTKEERDKQIVAISQRTTNELTKIDIEHSTRTQNVWDEDAKYYKNLQEKRRDLFDEANSIILSIEKDKFDRIAKNEEDGVNYSLKVRQKAFEASMSLARKELDLQYIKDKARNVGDDAMLAKIEAAYQKANIALNNLISPTKQATIDTQKWIESLSNGELDKALDNIGLKSAKNLLDFDENGQTTFMKLMEGASLTESKIDDIAVAFQTLGDVAQDVMALIDQAEQKKYQNALDRLDKEKTERLKFAGDSEAAKNKINEEFDKKKKALEIKEFKRKQKMSIANIAIDTAQAAMASWAKTGSPWAVAAAIAMGAIQTAIVASQKPPEYWKGTDNAEAGLAWTQERGAEIVMDKNNRIKSFGSDGGAQLTMMEKGDKVKTASETKKIMFDNNLNSILSDNGIKEAKIEIINKGLTIDEMDKVMSKHFANIQTNHTSFDSRGIQSWSEKNGNKKINNSNRGSGAGFKV